MIRNDAGVKTVSVTCRGGFTLPGAEWHITVKDKTSGVVFCDIQFTPEEFFNLLASRGSEGRMEAYDTFSHLGLKHEMKHVIVADSRLKGYRSEVDYQQIVDDHKAEFEVDGWIFDPVGTVLSQGQHDSSAMTLRMVMRRYVKEVQS